jgi:SAM-dependent methyltransferase
VTSQPAQPSSWGSVAAKRARWNAFFEEMTAPVNDWLCESILLAPGKRALDIACGTGHPALSAARRVRPGGSVVGIDIAPEMVEAATELAAAEGLDNTEFRVMNAENLDFPDASFDAVTSRWGIMFPDDVAKTVREVFRVLRPGGRVSFAFWDDQDKNPRQGFLETVIRKALAEPPRPRGAGGVAYKFADPQPLVDLLTDAGFRIGALETVTFSYDFKDSDDFWQGLTEAWPSGRVSSLEPLQLGKVRELFPLEAEQFRDRGLLRLPSSNHCLWAEKP